MSEKLSTYGGRRAGAGRKQVYVKLVRRTITLLPDHAQLLEKLGNGNLSAGVRILVEAHKAAQ